MMERLDRDGLWGLACSISPASTVPTKNIETIDTLFVILLLYITTMDLTRSHQDVIKV